MTFINNVLIINKNFYKTALGAVSPKYKTALGAVSPMYKTAFRSVSLKYNPVMNFNNTQVYNPIIGSNLGIPLNLLQYIFTSTYYHENIVNFELILMQFAIGVFTYGTDRLFDAFDYAELKNANFVKNLLSYLKNGYITNDSIDINTTAYTLDKIKYYNYILDNVFQNIFIIFFSYFYILDVLLQHEETYPLLLLLTSTIFYRNFKQNFGEFKALYIGIFWTIGCIILPCVLHDHNYEIINHPNIYLPSLFAMFASSNLLDINDIDEDKNEGINTIPVILGKTNSIYLSYFFLILSFFIFSFNDSFYNFKYLLPLTI